MVEAAKEKEKEKTPVEQLVDTFVQQLTPSHHAVVAAPYATMEVNKKELAAAAHALLESFTAHMRAESEKEYRAQMLQKQADEEKRRAQVRLRPAPPVGQQAAVSPPAADVAKPGGVVGEQQASE